jgi:hypothetical protein
VIEGIGAGAVTASDRLKERIAEMQRNGLINLKFSVGERWGSLTHEERCAAILGFLDAKKIPATGPVRSGRPPVDVRGFVGSFDE